MSNFVLFENVGEIPVNAFKLLGASSKRGDASKIGFYGTGLKYAIVLMLRENIPFKVYSGLNEVKISKRATKFLDQKIEVLTVNGEKTSITLDAGVDWEPWYAIREIYSNTVDEGGTMKINATVLPEKDKTKIYVDLDAPKLKDIFANWNNYFTTSRVVVEKQAGGNILPKLPSNPFYTIFRKGIRAYSNEYHSLFDYDLRDLEINESRVAKYSWETRQGASKLLAKSSLDIILEFIKLGKSEATKDYVEWQSEFWEYTGSTFNKDWLVAIDNRKLVPNDYAGRYDLSENTLILPDKLLKKLKEAFGRAVHIVGQDDEPYTLANDIDKAKIYKSVTLLQAAGLTFNKELIHVADFADNSILGTVDRGKIILSTRLLADQEKELDSTLLEEVIHLKTGFADSTRSLQDYLFRTIIYLIKHGKQVNEKA